jgi:hypothetical protein
MSETTSIRKALLEVAMVDMADAVSRATAVSHESPGDYDLRMSVVNARAAQRQAVREFELYCLQVGESRTASALANRRQYRDTCARLVAALATSLPWRFAILEADWQEGEGAAKGFSSNEKKRLALDPVY